MGGIFKPIAHVQRREARCCLDGLLWYGQSECIYPTVPSTMLSPQLGVVARAKRAQISNHAEHDTASIPCSSTAQTDIPNCDKHDAAVSIPSSGTGKVSAISNHVEHDTAGSVACSDTSNAINTTNHAKHYVARWPVVAPRSQMQIPGCAENDTAASVVCSDPGSG